MSLFTIDAGLSMVNHHRCVYLKDQILRDTSFGSRHFQSISQSSLVLSPQHRSFLLYTCEISTKTPITGRTHQLRVHCAAMGHPILGDPAYGFCGEAHPNGGFSDDTMSTLPSCASFELRRAVEDAVRENGRTMCLHARQLTVQHPTTNEEVSFEASPSF